MQQPDDSQPVAGQETKEKFGSALLHGVDLGVALLILAGCALLYYATAQFEQVADLLAQNIPPQFFPRLLIWCIVILAVMLPFEHLVHLRGKKHLDSERRHRIKPIAMFTAGLLILMVALKPVLGTYLTMIFVCISLPLLWGDYRLKIVLPFAILFPTAVMLLFNKALRVHFDPGLLGLIWG